MRILVAGAAGAIGLRLIPRLVADGHSVVGLTRSSRKASRIRELGAEPAVVDALDRAAVRAAVAMSRPEVLIHELTALEGQNDLRHFDRAFAMTNRLRMEGTDNLLSVARESGIGRIIAQSFCGWPYARIGGQIKSETDPLDPNPPKECRCTLAAIQHVEQAVTTLPAITGIVLRYGALYGPDSGILASSVIDQLKRRRMPLVGKANGWWSFVHVDDAAAATALAVRGGNPGIYNVVDDDPAPVREWLPALAQFSKSPQPVRVPVWLARILAGKHLVNMMTEARAGSNAKAKRELGWSLLFGSWRQGFASSLIS